MTLSFVAVSYISECIWSIIYANLLEMCLSNGRIRIIDELAKSLISKWSEDYYHSFGENQTKQGSVKYGCNIHTESTVLYAVPKVIFPGAKD